MIGRRFRRGGNAQHLDLNVIPLIDVVFFLLVFYVISTSFDQVTAVDIDKPQSGRASSVQAGFVPVAVVKSGAIHVGPLVVDLPQLDEAVRGALARGNAERVLLIADREVPTGLLLQVMDGCYGGGASSVDVAADRAGR